MKIEVDSKEIDVFRDLLDLVNQIVFDEDIPLDIRQYYKLAIVRILQEGEINNNVRLYTKR